MPFLLLPSTLSLSEAGSFTFPWNPSIRPVSLRDPLSLSVSSTRIAGKNHHTQHWKIKRGSSCLYSNYRQPSHSPTHTHLKTCYYSLSFFQLRIWIFANVVSKRVKWTRSYECLSVLQRILVLFPATHNR